MGSPSSVIRPAPSVVPGEMTRSEMPPPLSRFKVLDEPEPLTKLRPPLGTGLPRVGTRVRTSAPPCPSTVMLVIDERGIVNVGDAGGAVPSKKSICPPELRIYQVSAPAVPTRLGPRTFTL